MMNKPTIALWDTVGLGVIVAYPIGVMVSNQTGGTACLRPQIEGVYLSLGNDCTDDHQFLSPQTALSTYFEGPRYNGTGATKGLDEADADFINSVLAKFQLDHFLSVDVARLSDSHEAWVWVVIQQESSGGLISGFASTPLVGVLTWGNSD